MSTKKATSILKLYRGNVRHAAYITYEEDHAGRQEVKGYEFFCGLQGYKTFHIPNYQMIKPNLNNVTCKNCRRILIEKGAKEKVKAEVK